MYYVKTTSLPFINIVKYTLTLISDSRLFKYRGRDRAGLSRIRRGIIQTFLNLELDTQTICALRNSQGLKKVFKIVYSDLFSLL